MLNSIRFKTPTRRPKISDGDVLRDRAKTKLPLQKAEEEVRLLKKLIVSANVFELKTDHKYIVALSREVFTGEDALNLLKSLKEIGIEHSVALMGRGDPNTAIKIIEEKPDVTP